VHDPERPEDVADSDGPPARSEVASGPETHISITEAEDEVARAEARADAARARVERLRRAAEAEEAKDDGAVTQAVKPRATKTSRSRLRWRKAVAASAAIVLFCASLAASGYMAWQHYTMRHNRQLAAEFAAAARLGVTALMSIDAHHAKEDIQRLIDACTGHLKMQLEAESGLMVSHAEDSKVVSTVTVEATAVESVSDNSGVVLVAAKSDVTNPDNTKRPPALWRLSVDVDRDGGQLKMSKVDFLQ
jgi:Mce-associated membrane protein